MSARPRLGFSVDGIAALRQTRRATAPDPVEAALVAERAGVDQICAHLWQDRRHIQERDVDVLRRVVKTELALYLAPSGGQLETALAVRPDTVTFVAERDGAVEVEGGIDVLGAKDGLERSVRLLAEAGLRVSALIDPVVDQVRAAHKAGFHAVEIFTGGLAVARGFSERSAAASSIRDAAKTARKLGLGVAAGHGLGPLDVAPVARIPEILEINVGHALCAAAVIVGVERAVRDFLERMTEARSGVCHPLTRN